MKYFKLLFIVAACILNLVPLDASTVEIYYSDHPTCESAEYQGDVLEISTKDLDDRKNSKKLIEDFVKEVKANTATKFEANIICGGKYESNFYTYGGGAYRDVALTMTFTGTAMKTT